MMPNNKVTKAHFRGNPAKERKQFPQSSCLIPISVGQPVHEGVKFEATIRLVNKSFKSCTILVDDTVQRHTYAILNKDIPMNKLYEMALHEGSQWLERSIMHIHQLDIPFEILRWNDWLTHADFMKYYEIVLAHYKNNTEFQMEMNKNIDDFLTRHLRHVNISIYNERARMLCLNYLLEECAVMSLWPLEKYDFELYPSGRNKAMAATYKHIIQPNTPNYIRPVALRFKKYSPSSDINTLENYSSEITGKVA